VQLGQRLRLLANALLSFSRRLYLRWHSSKPNGAKAALRGLHLCSFIISILFYGLFLVGQDSIRLEFLAPWMTIVNSYALSLQSGDKR
jgi:hypothetical protein